VRLASAVALAVLLMIVDHRLAYLESVRSALSVLVYPIQYLVSLPVRGLEKVSAFAVDHQTLLERNAELRERNLLLQSKLQRFASLESENARLRELLDSSVEIGEQALVADLLAVELQPSSRQIVLNKGGKQGVYIGQPVVGARGVMGQVIHVGPFTSTALLITDLSHAMPVELNRTGLRALAVGTGEDDALELNHVPNNADVREGDLAVSSGLGGRFPRGYPVGEVVSVNAEPSQPFARIIARPSAQLLQAREVLLIWSGRHMTGVQDLNTPAVGYRHEP